MNHAQDFIVTITVRNDQLQKVVTGQASEYQQAQILVQAAVAALVGSGFSAQEAVMKVEQMAAISTLSEDEMMDDYWSDETDLPQ